MKAMQVGVIGSCTDLNYSKNAEEFAAELGRLIAEKGFILVFGAEKDIDSLPTVAARAAVEAGGITVGVTYEKGLDVYDNKAAQVVIASGMVRGGGRETTLVLSCDVVVAIAGGSGTLNEICIAYQAGIPTVAVSKFGGWSKCLAGTYLDDRKRYQIQKAESAEEALNAIVSILI